MNILSDRGWGVLVVLMTLGACSSDDAALGRGGAAGTGGVQGPGGGGSAGQPGSGTGGNSAGAPDASPGGSGGDVGGGGSGANGGGGGGAAAAGSAGAGGTGAARDSGSAGARDSGASTIADGAPDAREGDARAIPGALIHPGAMLTQGDLDKIRTNVAAGREPWASAWAALQRSTSEGANYQPNVKPVITNSDPDGTLLQNQGHAAYVLAMKWVASGDAAYATAAKRVLDGWVNTVTSMDTTTLRTGIGAVQFANAAEIIAHGFNRSAGWPPAQVAKAQAWMKSVVWVRIGSANLQRSSNWGTSAMAGCMATAIFTDDLAKFDYTVNAYKNGFSDAPDGCSGVAQYICTAAGQPTEAGRDQGHPQGGVAHLVETAQMAWNQGTNLVPFAGNRLVAGMEYVAKYNLGNDDVPYDANFPDPCNVHPSWTVISTLGRGAFSPVYESANRLFTLANVPHPYTAQVVASPGYVPEATNSDHCGMGTLAFR